LVFELLTEGPVHFTHFCRLSANQITQQHICDAIDEAIFVTHSAAVKPESVGNALLDCVISPTVLTDKGKSSSSHRDEDPNALVIII
jgi:hypothetical protein